jgi:hypothetical protein
MASPRLPAQNRTVPRVQVAAAAALLAGLAMGGLWFAGERREADQIAYRANTAAAAEAAQVALGRNLQYRAEALRLALLAPEARTEGVVLLDGANPVEDESGLAPQALLAGLRLLPGQSVLLPARPATGEAVLVQRTEGERPAVAFTTVRLEPGAVAEASGVTLRVVSADGRLLLGAAGGPAAASLPLAEGGAWVEASAPLPAFSWPLALAPFLLGSVTLIALASLRRPRAEPRAAEAERRRTPREEPASPEALIATWPHAAALVDAEGRILARNAAFTAAAERAGVQGELTAMRFWRAVLPGGRAVAARMALLNEGGEAVRQMRDGRRVTDRVTAIRPGCWLLECREHPPEDPFALCAEELRARMPLLRNAVRAAELRAAREHAHAMRGLAGNFGLDELLPPLARIEAAARNADPATAEEALAALETRFSGLGRLQAA